MTGSRLAGRIAVVTGASRGLGAAVAKRFAAEGAHVVLVARTEAGLVEVDDAVRAAGGSATIAAFDLLDSPAIDRLGAALFERYKKLDVLVGAAAELGTITPVGHIGPKDWDRVMALNVTANWRLVRSLDPLLRASDAGRAVFVTDRVAAEAAAYWGTYAASKSALETMARIYANEMATSAVRVNLVDPGPLRTKLRAKAFPGEDPMLRPHPDSVTEIFVALAEATCVRHGEIVRAAATASEAA
jgi:NAD(P)-dependent dehydrogenase (short-subunit alcohol dehydrogenase family)